MTSPGSPPEDFYAKWLGVRPGPRPPDHYSLLGVKRFETAEEMIKEAAKQRTQLVRSLCLKFPEAGTEILNQIAKARVCLLDPAARQEYDSSLVEIGLLEDDTGPDAVVPLAAPPEPSPGSVKFELYKFVGDTAAKPAPEAAVATPPAAPDQPAPRPPTRTPAAKPVRKAAVDYEDDDDLDLEEEVERQERKKWLLIGGVAAAVVILAAAGVLMIRKPKPQALPEPDLTEYAGAEKSKSDFSEEGSKSIQSVLPDKVGLLRTLAGHTNQVSSVAFAPDGQHILSGGKDRTMRLWNINSEEAVRTFTGHTDWITCVAFAPDGVRALSGSYDRTLRVYELSTGHEWKRLIGHSDHVLAAAFSPIGGKILSGGRDRSMRVWDSQSGLQLHECKGHTSGVTALAFTPDASKGVTGSDDGSLKLWDLSTGKELHTYGGSRAGVVAIVVAPDGKSLYAACKDNTCWLLDTEKRGEPLYFQFQSGSVTCAAFTPDAKEALFGTEYGRALRFWDLVKVKELHRIDGDVSRLACAAYASRDRLVVFGRTDGSLQLRRLPKVDLSGLASGAAGPPMPASGGPGSGVRGGPAMPGTGALGAPMGMTGGAAPAGVGASALRIESDALDLYNQAHRALETGANLNAKNDHGGALREFQNAHALFRRLRSDYPQTKAAQQSLKEADQVGERLPYQLYIVGRSCLVKGAAYNAKGEYFESGPLLDQAEECFRTLIKDYPRSPYAKNANTDQADLKEQMALRYYSQGRALLSLAQYNQKEQKLTEAREYLDKAKEAYQKVLDNYPKTRVYASVQAEMKLLKQLQP